MIAILTSSLGGSSIVEGKRVPTYLLKDNGLIEIIKRFWNESNKVIIISADPQEYERNNSILFCQRAAFEMSSLKSSSFTICDYRNIEIIKEINNYDVIILAGGHVPTQSKFFEKIGLKDKLVNYNGLIIAWSAGSMNSAEVVYSQPEIEGEGINPNYKRFIDGLGITNKMIIPHYESVKMDILDGMKVMEDITYPDSFGKEFIALNDGSFIVSIDGDETLYGEAYLIKDGNEIQICKRDEAKKCDIVQ